MSITKKVFVGAFVAAFALVAMKADAAYVHTTTLKLGSKGAQVMALQQALNAGSCKVAMTGVGSAGMESTTFGPKTVAAVKCFQAANGLTADGVVGPMTGAKIGLIVAVPAGNPNTPCPAGYVCTPTGNNNGGSTTLSGTDGTIADVNELSSYNNEEVGEGQNDVKVAGFEVKASNDGDIQLTSGKISFVITNGSGSVKLSDYVDSVTVWQGSTKIGSADASDFNKDSTGNYSKTIAFSNAVVKADKTERFYISVDAPSTFDSGDIDSETVTVDVDNLRYKDGSGVVTTETGYDLTSMDVPVAFVSFSTAADTKLQVSKSTDSPKAGIVMVDDSGKTTDNVSLLSGKLKLEGKSDVTINEFPVTFTTTGTASVAAATGSVTLKIDGEEFGKSVSFAGQTGTVVFDNLDLNVDAGSTVNFEVLADINDIDASTLVAGDTIKASVTSTNLSQMDVENEEGDQLADSTEKTGSAIGEAQELRANGIALSLINTSAEVTTGSSNYDDVGTFTIKFKVTAVGSDVYVGTTVAQGYLYAVDDSGVATTGGLSAVVVNDTDTDVTAQGNYLIEEGTSENFTLTVVHSGAPSDAGLYRAALTGVKWDVNDNDTTLANTYSSNLDAFKTPYKSLN